jgi:hypothetical protein
MAKRERERESQVCGQWVSILGQHHAGPINVLFQFLMSSPGWNASQEDSLAVRNEPRCIAEQDILGSTSIATLEAVCVYKQAGLAKRGLFQALWCENLEMLCPTKMVHILAKIVPYCSSRQYIRRKLEMSNIIHLIIAFPSLFRDYMCFLILSATAWL